MRAMPQQTKAGMAVRRPVLTQAREPRFSEAPFPEALKGLMEERHLSYRQLAYKTQLSAGYLNHLTKGSRPVPADLVIENLAAALKVGPDFFLEYRLRQVAQVLGDSPPLADRLYRILICEAPVTDDVAELLEEGRKSLNGGNGRCGEADAIAL
jgi:transcriptional regulator with XRE-family HTH domain